LEEPLPVSRSCRVNSARNGFFLEYGLAAGGASITAVVASINQWKYLSPVKDGNARAGEAEAELDKLR
jgi:hypothetical protein